MVNKYNYKIGEFEQNLMYLILNIFFYKNLIFFYNLII